MLLLLLVPETWARWVRGGSSVLLRGGNLLSMSTTLFPRDSGVFLLFSWSILSPFVIVARRDFYFRADARRGGVRFYPLWWSCSDSSVALLCTKQVVLLRPADSSDQYTLRPTVLTVTGGNICGSSKVPDVSCAGPLWGSAFKLAPLGV